MKCFRRCFSFSLCFVLLLVAFSPVVSASEADFPEYHIYHTYSPLGLTFTSFLGDDETQSGARALNDVPAGTYTHVYNMYFATDDNTILIPEGRTSRIFIENIYWDLSCSAFSNNKTTVDPSQQFGTYLATFFGIATDGSRYYENVPIESTFKSDGTRDLTFCITPGKNLSQLCISIQYKFTTPETSRLVVNIGEQDLNTKYYKLNVDTETNEESLLQGIGDSISSGFSNMISSLTGGFNSMLSSLSSGFQSVVDGITNLPNKLWSLIEEGIKGLFVPDDDYLVSYKENWDSLLEDRLGAVYEVSNIVFESWERITDADANDSIVFPETRLELPDNAVFVFGSNEQVPIVPEGFQFLADALKLFVGALCTVAFINGLRKRYEEIMGVEK